MASITDFVIPAGPQSAAQANTIPAKIDLLGRVSVEVGLGLAKGQELLITAPLDALPLVRSITEYAYRAGASLVTTIFNDEQATLLRFRHALDDSFDHAASWLHDGFAAAFRSGVARLAVAGADPTLLSSENPDKVARANLAQSRASRPALDLITRHEINWTIVPCATPAWARLVFPDDPNALDRLWSAIFASTRIQEPDPIAAWREHSNRLQQRVRLLNEKRFSALHFRGPGTDLQVGLAEGNIWLGGGTVARNGLACIPNMPTEEVFTTPHKDRVEGFATSTKPLSYQGSLIENIRVRFANGRIVEAHADKGESILRSMIETDEGARKLGEVALVPHSSPISKSGLLFWNTLFDENAASHIALGQAYSTCIQHGDSMDQPQLAAKGANDSLIHVDWMIGSGEINVDGLHKDGETEPLMRLGEWV
ncbi:MAG: aminopeptidase [Bryobacterales bacterium]|nr:aminopeptidase [Bryobacterales bacterium]